MPTISYKTRSEITEKKMPSILGNNQYRGKTIIALDRGYSSVKGVSPDRTFIFPSYAKRIDKELEIIGAIKNSDIQFRDNITGDIWLVGASAINQMTREDLDSTTDMSLYTRHIYSTDAYKVTMATGMAIGCIGAGDNEIYLQTGLPAQYKVQDEAKLIKALAGHYDISIKLGTSDWINFVFDLPEDHIFVMEQPKGTLCACCYGSDGATANGLTILKANTIILDIGFGTEDIFSIRSGAATGYQTYNDTAMRAVFDGTLREIINQGHNIDTKVFELQTKLEEGVLQEFDVDTLTLTDIPFGDILEKKNRELCEKSIRRLLQDYNNLIDYKYLIVTGGTGESRYEWIKDMLKGLPHLKVIAGNQSYPDMPYSLSNVLGYYTFRHGFLKKAAKEVS